MAKDEKYKNKYEAIMAWLDSLLDKDEDEKPTRTSGKSLAEQINWGGKFDSIKRKAEGGSVEKEFEINSYEVDGKEMLAIDFKDGKRIFEDQMIEMFDLNKTAPMTNPKITDDPIINFLRENNPTRNEFIKHFITKFLAKGGTPMDEQMSMFNEGGLLDEGGEVDEESGNDVPIGGTKEGVRDDIPAMLSEGEFVFPEDVTRYHGLEKLMTLRQEAKMGLKKMEAMGQMGNSEEATIPDDLPFNMDDLILVMSEEEPKKKDDEPIKAQAGTFVPATQQQNNMGVMGFQQSMYGQQGLQNPATAVMPQIPASSVAPTIQAPQVGGYNAPMTGYSPNYATTPVPTIAEPVEQVDFIPNDLYKNVKYINPTTGETMMINEYQGNPVSAVPAGYIRYDDYLASGGTDTEDEVTGSETGTGVDTAQVAVGGRGTTTDDERRENKKLFDTLKANTERKRVEKYNTLLAEGSTNDILGEYKKSKTGRVFSAGLGPLSIPTNLLLSREQKKIEAAYLEAAKREGIDEETAKKNLKEVSVLSSAKDTIGGFGKGIKDTFFTKGGLDKYNRDYDAKYSLEDFSKATRGDSAPRVQGYIKGSMGNNLSSIQQQQFDIAIENGNMATARHHELVGLSNAARTQFAKENPKLIRDAQKGSETAKEALRAKLQNKKYYGVTLGFSSLDNIIKYGGGVVTAVEDGRAEEGGTFKSAKVVNPTAGVAGEKGPLHPSYSAPSKPTSSEKPPKSTYTGPISTYTPSAAAQIQAAIEKKRRDDRDQSISRTQPTKTKTKKSTSKANQAAAATRKSSSRQPSRAQQMAVQGIKKGGLMEKDK